MHIKSVSEGIFQFFLVGFPSNDLRVSAREVAVAQQVALVWEEELADCGFEEEPAELRIREALCYQA
jgi:hypothetical protein